VKKARVKIRKVWTINPRTRRVPGKKAYSRPKAKLQTKKVIDNEAQ
jgi:hypothetical protein